MIDRAVAPVLAARAMRDFADGFLAIILPVYLLRLGYTAIEVGLIATSALLGSSLMTIAIGLIGSRFDQRRLLIAAAMMMVGTGLLFAVSESLGLLLIVAFAGTANPSAGNVSIFVPLEHPVLARSVEAGERTRLFARYSLIGALAAAAGSFFSATPEFLTAAGIEELASIKAMFVLYALFGLAGGALYRRIPPTPPLPEGRPPAALGPSRRMVYKLAALFSLDAFSGGFVVQSIMVLWLFDKFDMSLVEAGAFFSAAGVASAFSFPVAVWLSRRIGLVNTMVFTHIPASLCLMAAAFAPTLTIALGLLLVRAFLNQMDVPTRSSYVMAVVTEAERPAAASFTAVPRGLGLAGGPAIAGAMLAASYFTLPLMISGVLKITYDILLLYTFRHVKPPEEQ